MPMSLADHHHRLRDVETAFEVLRRLILDAQPDAQARLIQEADRLRANAKTGAADLLAGDPHRAAYRR